LGEEREPIFAQRLTQLLDGYDISLTSDHGQIRVLVDLDPSATREPSSFGEHCKACAHGAFTICSGEES
jgi:hypothetical protein